MQPRHVGLLLVVRSVCRIHHYHSGSPLPQLGLMKMRVGVEMAYPSDLAPLAPLRDLAAFKLFRGPGLAQKNDLRVILDFAQNVRSYQS